jgi:RNA recognition motif-containing protein
MKIYVGNLSFSATEDVIKEAFAQFGTVITVNIIKDKFSGNSKGFAFVEMQDAQEAQRAIDALNNKDLMGRPLRVNEARPQEENRDRYPRSNGGSSDRSRGGFGGSSSSSNGGRSQGGYRRND